MLSTAAIKRIFLATATFSLKDARNKPFFKHQATKIEDRLTRDPVARSRNIKTIEEFINFVEAIPERLHKVFLLEKTYLRWIFERYAKGGIGSISDIDQTWENFGIFHAGKSRIDPSKRDVNRLKTLHDLDNLIKEMQQHGQTKSKRQEKHAQRRELMDQLVQKKAIKKHYDDAKISVWIPLTYEGAQFLGLGSLWCTGGEKGASKGYFDDFNRQGPLYDIFIKKTSETLTFTKKDGTRVSGKFQKRYQVHFESTSYANAADHTVDPQEIRKLAPTSLRQAFPKRAEFNPKMSESAALQDIKQRPSVLKFLEKPSDKVILAAIDNGDIQLLADVNSKFISPKLQLEIIQRDPENIQHLTKPTIEAAKAAINANPELALYINPLTDELARYTCQKDASMLDYCNIFLEEEID